MRSAYIFISKSNNFHSEINVFKLESWLIVFAKVSKQTKRNGIFKQGFNAIITSIKPLKTVRESCTCIFLP